jgi:hypothetical protein
VRHKLAWVVAAGPVLVHPASGVLAPIQHSPPRTTSAALPRYFFNIHDGQSEGVVLRFSADE